MTRASSTLEFLLDRIAALEAEVTELKQAKETYLQTINELINERTSK